MAVRSGSVGAGAGAALGVGGCLGALAGVLCSFAAVDLRGSGFGVVGAEEKEEEEEAEAEAEAGSRPGLYFSFGLKAYEVPEPGVLVLFSFVAVDFRLTSGFGVVGAEEKEEVEAEAEAEAEAEEEANSRPGLYFSFGLKEYEVPEPGVSLRGWGWN